MATSLHCGRCGRIGRRENERRHGRQYFIDGRVSHYRMKPTFPMPVLYRKLPALSTQDIERFWSKVDRSPNCWLWTSRKFKNGYGKFTKCKVDYAAHRIAYLVHQGCDPGEVLVCHTCDNHACVRGSHLFLGTHQINSNDMKSKGRSAVGDRNGMRTHPHRTSPGERNGHAKLTDAEVREICRLYDSGAATQPELAVRFNVWQMTISRIVRRISRTTAHSAT